MAHRIAGRAGTGFGAKNTLQKGQRGRVESAPDCAAGTAGAGSWLAVHCAAPLPREPTELLVREGRASVAEAQFPTHAVVGFPRPRKEVQLLDSPEK